MARSEDGISRLLPPLRGTFQMSPLLHALDDGDDPHQVPEQLVQLCMLLSDPFTNEFDDISWTTSSTSRSDMAFLCLWARGASCLGTALLCMGTDSKAKARHWIPVITHGLYTHACSNY